MRKLTHGHFYSLDNRVRYVQSIPLGHSLPLTLVHGVMADVLTVDTRKLEAEMEDQQSYNEQMTQTARQLQTAVCATVSERPPPVRKTGRTKPPASR